MVLRAYAHEAQLHPLAMFGPPPPPPPPQMAMPTCNMAAGGARYATPTEHSIATPFIPQTRQDYGPPPLWAPLVPEPSFGQSLIPGATSCVGMAPGYEHEGQRARALAMRVQELEQALRRATSGGWTA